MRKRIKNSTTEPNIAKRNDQKINARIYQTVCSQILMTYKHYNDFVLETKKKTPRLNLFKKINTIGMLLR